MSLRSQPVVTSLSVVLMMLLLFCVSDGADRAGDLVCFAPQELITVDEVPEIFDSVLNAIPAHQVTQHCPPRLEEREGREGREGAHEAEEESRRGWGRMLVVELCGEGSVGEYMAR
eukprot:2463627-Rhodomonas_salina.2